jgi:sporulation integral membrane protein YtvI
MKEFYIKNKEDVDKVIHFAIIVLCIYIFVKYLATYFSPLIVGYIICLVLSPLVNLLNKRLKLPRPLASVVSLIFMIFVLFALANSILSKLFDEAKSFIENSPNLVESVTATIRGFQEKFSEYLDLLPDSMRDSASELGDSLTEVVASTLGTGVKVGSIGIVKFLPGTMFVILLGLICSFFLLNDRQKIEDFIARQFPKSFAERMRVARNGVLHAIGGYVRAQCILMSIVAVICVTGLVILGNSYALLMGVLIAFVDALPVFGSGAIFWPWALYSILIGNYKMAIGLAIINITVLLTRQILEPRVLGSQIGLHPLATLMSIFVGLKVFGLFGFIIGPIILVTIKALQDNGLLPEWK